LDKFIRIRGARQHNLKNCNVDIPRNCITVVSGVSGSGKSTLVFDTLYAEGQRAYVESLSTYARQFLSRMPKPDVDYIDGISPAIAIEQRNSAKSSRSTVGTVTEINDYLRVLFARVGKTVCRDCDIPIKPDSPAGVWRATGKLTSNSDPVIIAFPFKVSKENTSWADSMLAQGFRRVVIDTNLVRLDEDNDLNVKHGVTIDIVIDRVKVEPQNRSRFAEAVELAMIQSGGFAVIISGDNNRNQYSDRRLCSGCNTEFPELTPHLFSFNSPHGACPECNGFGNKLEFDERKIIPDDMKTISDGTVKPWSTPSFADDFAKLIRFCRREKIPINKPWQKLTEAHKRKILEGSKGVYLAVIPFLEKIRREMKQHHHRFFVRRFMGDTDCRTCNGTRLRKEARAVKVGRLELGALSRMTIEEALNKVEKLKLSKNDFDIAEDIRLEVESRLQFMHKVGLGYLTLDRLTRTLSGGEAQRIHLANSIGSRLVDTLYVLDEPTTGLHASDVQKLIATLRDLADSGNTVVVVEHDLDVLRAGDWFIEIGPAAGDFGGEIVYQGKLDELLKSADTLTARYMRGESSLEFLAEKRGNSKSALVVKGARLHNLKNIDVRIPLQRFVCLTGVSGSGKSTLMNHIIGNGLTGKAEGSAERTSPYTGFQGAHWINKVVTVDQSPIGKSSRSNPATYLQVLTPIRELFAETVDAKAKGFTASSFSFNTAGGRCPECNGLGEHRVEMHFMADISVQCDQCKGSRFSSKTLEVKFKGKSIADVLDMTVAQALEFFSKEINIRNGLLILRKVGLGYLKLGQPATTLSGGESQRLKIARELISGGTFKNLYLLDEPTTGLHVDDVKALATVLHELVEKGHSVVVIEHNLDLIAQADWIVDMGPGGGQNGGKIVAEGTPLQFERYNSLTGQYLKQRKLQMKGSK
jgi:excinuclease ABC subunit A